MDFSIKKPSHWGVFFLLIVSFLVFIGFPILSFIGGVSSPNGNNGYRLNELILLVIQLLLVFFFFIAVPILWYRVVNGFSTHQLASSIGLRREGLDLALIWGIITAIVAFTVVLSTSLILNILGVDISKASNIEELKQFFSTSTLIVLILIQPAAEEFFFRGFLLDKLSSLFGIPASIIISSILFGLAHLSYGNVYPATMTTLVGIVLAASVIRTKNLYTSITAHILFNLISFLLYIFAELFRVEALILW